MSHPAGVRRALCSRDYFAVVAASVEDQVGASSTDGRTFEVRGLPGTEVPGDLVVLRTSAGPPALGQLLGARTADGGMVRSGAILGALDPDGAVSLGTVSPFVGASLEGATREVWAALERKRAADMEVGTTRAGPGLLASSCVQPAHLPVRTERLREVLRHGRSARAAADRHRPPDDDPRPERRLRRPRRDARHGRPGRS